MTCQKIKLLSILIPVLLFSFGCKKDYLDTRPSDEVPIDDAFKTTVGCKAAVHGINRLMFGYGGDHDLFGEPSVMLMEDLMGEDMSFAKPGSGWLLSVYDYSSARSASSVPGYTWTFYYRIISNTNLILANIDNAEGPEEDRLFIKGQAYFYRAFAYYKLSLYYQQTLRGEIGGMSFSTAPGIPIYTEPTQKGNPRPPLEDNYNQIVSDLKDALELLPNGTRDNKSDPDLSVAKGLYARVALVMNDWALAAQMAEEAMSGYSFMNGQALLNSGFNDINNSEWMWGAAINNEQSGIYASFLSHMVVASGGYALAAQKVGYKPLCDSLQVGRPTDIRKDWWYGFSGMPDPYERHSQRKFTAKEAGNWASDIVFMRASEMLLIRAEGLAMSGNVPLAAQELEEWVKIRDESFVAPTTRDALVAEVLWQRRIELWGEGFRFSDIKRQMALPMSIIPDAQKGLKRTGFNSRPPNHLRAYMGNTSDIGPYSNMFLFRIPGSEVNLNDGVTQNP